MRKLIFFLSVIILTLTFVGCENEDDTTPMSNDYNSGEGVFITNEGLFNTGNASVSYYHFESGEISNEIFQNKNGRQLGDILQSATRVGDEIYFALNNSSVVEGANIGDMASTGTIEDVGSPRYIVPVTESKAYVSELFGSEIHVVDLDQKEKIGSIPFPGWSEEMLKVDDEVFVCNSWFFGTSPTNQVYVINPSTDEVIDSIEVGIDPRAIVEDSDKMLWIYCNGNPNEGELGGLYRVDPEVRQLTRKIDFPDFNTGFAPRMMIDNSGTGIYFTKNDLYFLNTDDTSFPDQPLIAAGNRSFYALGVSPFNGDLYIGDAKDYQQRGTVYRYQPDGMMVDSVTAGVIPNGFIFY